MLGNISINFLTKRFPGYFTACQRAKPREMVVGRRETRIRSNLPFQYYFPPSLPRHKLREVERRSIRQNFYFLPFVSGTRLCSRWKKREKGIKTGYGGKGQTDLGFSKKSFGVLTGFFSVILPSS